MRIMPEKLCMMFCSKLSGKKSLGFRVEGFAFGFVEAVRVASAICPALRHMST